MFVEQHEDKVAEKAIQKRFLQSHGSKKLNHKSIICISVGGMVLGEGETVQFLDRNGGAGRGKSHGTAVREGDDMVRRKQMSLCKLKF